MHRYKPPKTSVFDYLTHINYYLNEKNKDLTSTNELLKANNDYMNQFILSAFDLSGNYAANVRIVVYDESNNILSQIFSDSMGNVRSDIPVNSAPIQNDMVRTNEHITDLSRCYQPYFTYPYGYPGYHYDYPYGYPHYPFSGSLLDDDNDYFNRGIDTSINHPISTKKTTYKSPVDKPIHPSDIPPPINRADVDRSFYYPRPHPHPYPHPYPHPCPPCPPCPHPHPYQYNRLYRNTVMTPYEPNPTDVPPAHHYIH
jgi:hypothetical protein